MNIVAIAAVSWRVVIAAVFSWIAYLAWESLSLGFNWLALAGLCWATLTVVYTILNDTSLIKGTRLQKFLDRVRSPLGWTISIVAIFAIIGLQGMLIETLFGKIFG